MEISRFPTVCNNCKWRKKACDKKLPSCTYCTKKSIACHYPDPSSSGLARTRANTPPGFREAWNLNKNSQEDFTVNQLATTARSELLMVHSISDHAYLLPLSGFPCGDESADYDSIMHKRVSRLLQTTGLSIAELQQQLPSGIYSSLPIILRVQFTSYQHTLVSSDTPSAEVSMLVLAASILALGSGKNTRATQLVDPESLYLATKMLYAQAQAIIPVSLTMVQTGLLISMYEYLSGRCQVAMQTIATCAAMLHIYEVNIGFDYVLHPESSEAVILELVWWCILICERLVACEIRWKSELFALKCPDTITRFPHNPNMPDRENPDDQTVRSLLLSQDISMPGRGLPGTVKAIMLLDRVFAFIDLPSPVQPHLSRASALDQDLRTFLNAALEFEANEGGRCTSISTTVQAMFLFHTHIVKTTRNNSEMVTLQRESREALKSMTRIMIELAHSNAEGQFLANIDEAPPNCRYVASAALNYLKERCSNGADADQHWSENEIRVLENFIAKLEKRWLKVGS